MSIIESMSVELREELIQELASRFSISISRYDFYSDGLVEFEFTIRLDQEELSSDSLTLRLDG